MKSIAMGLLLGCGACTAATIIGAGSGITTSTQDNSGGDRLNVHQDAVTLTAGTYDVASWSLNVAAHTAGTAGAGTITPMLLTGSPSTYTTLWVGSAFDPTGDGEQTVATSGSFTLATDTDVYAGFFTQSLGSNIIRLQTSGGPTSHDSSFTAPTAAAQSVTSFSNPSLNRQYAFGISVVPEPSSPLLLSFSALAFTLRRRR